MARSVECLTLGFGSGGGIEPHVRLCAECGACFTFSLPLFPSPLFPLLALVLALLKKKKNIWDKTHNVKLSVYLYVQRKDTCVGVCAHIDVCIYTEDGAGELGGPSGGWCLSTAPICTSRHVLCSLQ